MIRNITRLFLAATTASLLLVSNATAEDTARMTRAEVETIVKEYLLDNPEILLEVSRALSQKQQAQAAQKLFESDKDAILGNPDGKTVVAEFFDYNCSYCRAAYGEVQKAIAANPDLKVVLKEYPILGPDSQDAHVVAVALRRIAPELYAEFHNQMYTTDGRATEEKAIEVATDLGVPEDALRAAMAEDETEQQLAETQQLGLGLQVNGTPTYFDAEGPFGFDQLMARTVPEGQQDG